MIDPATTVILCRFLTDMTALLVWGSTAYLWLALPPALRAALLPRAETAWIFASAILFLATLALLPAQVAQIGNGWRDAMDTAVVGSVLTQTSVGTAWIVQFCGSAVLLHFSRLARPWKVAGLAIASLIVLVSLTISGHAAMHGGWVGVAHRLNDLAHIAAGGVWFGALPVVARILTLRDGQIHAEHARAALMRFSTIGHGAVTLVILTGLANSALILQRVPQDFASPYLQLLVLKVALVASAVGLALLNRYVLVPRMARSLSAGRTLVVFTLCELVLFAGIVGLVAWFGTLEPG